MEGRKPTWRLTSRRTPGDPALSRVWGEGCGWHPAGRTQGPCWTPCKHSPAKRPWSRWQPALREALSSPLPQGATAGDSQNSTTERASKRASGHRPGFGETGCVSGGAGAVEVLLVCDEPWNSVSRPGARWTFEMRVSPEERAGGSAGVRGGRLASPSSNTPGAGWARRGSCPRPMRPEPAPRTPRGGRGLLSTPNWN